MEDFQDSDDLFRQIPPFWWDVPKDRPKSQAFSDFKLSVDWSKLCKPEESQYRVEIEGSGVSGVAAIKVVLARNPELNQELIRDPFPDTDPANEAHCLIIGDKKRRSVRRAFARNCVMVIPCTL